MADADQKMVTIGCRHAPGVRLRVSEWFTVPGQPEPQLREIAIYDLAGVAPDYLGHQDGSEIGYTKIPAEHWEKWLALNERSDLYRSGTIYEAEEGEDEAPEAPQITAEREQEEARAAAEQQARDLAQAEADAKARAAEEAKAEAERQAKAATEQAERAGQGAGTAVGDGKEPQHNAELDAMSEDQLRAYLTEGGVTVDNRWGRKRLLTEAESLKAKS